MPNFLYTRDRPNPPNNPSSDVPDMLVNTNSTDDIIAVDHNSFNTNNGGYHTIIHQDPGAPRTWSPATQLFTPPVAAIAGFNQLLTGLYTPNTTGGVQDTQLFNITGGGTASQMTGNLIGDDGWVWCAGLLLQWGIVTSATSGSFPSGAAAGQVTFKDRVAGAIRYSNDCFVVFTSPFWRSAATVAPDGAASVNVDETTLSSTIFDWKFNSNSGKYRGFFWFAIGY